MKAAIQKDWNESTQGLDFAIHWIDELLTEGYFYSELCG